MTESTPGVSATFNGTNTVITLPAGYSPSSSIVVADTDSGYVYPSTRSGTTVTIDASEGDVADGPLTIGIVMVSGVQFATLYLRSRETGAPDIRGRTTVRYLKVHYADTLCLSASVAYRSTPGRRVYTFRHEEPQSGVFTVPIHGENTSVTVWLHNQEVDGGGQAVSPLNPLPMSITGYEWEGQHYTRLRGVR